MARRERVCFRGGEVWVEEAEAGVGGAEGMKREGIEAMEEMRAM